MVNKIKKMINEGYSLEQISIIYSDTKCFKDLLNDEKTIKFINKRCKKLSCKECWKNNIDKL